MTIRGIIFDMGGTLLDYHPPNAAPKQGWQQMENTGALALRAFLIKQGYNVPATEYALDLNFQVMTRHWRRIGEGETDNIRLGDMLCEVLSAWGLPPGVEQGDLLSEAQAIYTAPVQDTVVRPMAGAQDMLTAIQAAGFRVGLFSNTAWPGHFHEADLKRWGLWRYLECAFFSADVGVWKPRSGAFQLALDALGLTPAETVYVGDHPYFDVHGAQQAGLKAIWIRSDEWEDPAQLSAQFGLTITPDATIEQLADLPPLLAAWAGN